jgi:Arc/MetJ-type ribon-helix-helix transcriptional regulator
MLPDVTINYAGKGGSTMGKKVTYVLDEEVVEQVREVVGKGSYKSINSFVENAIKDELERIKKEEIKKAITEAGNDPLFLADIKEIEEDFKYADFEEMKK